jgi:hypothetical protein
MTSQENGETEDKELLDRYRRASDREVSAPSDAVRAAILAEGRRVAERLGKQGSPPTFDSARPAANDSRWKITAFGTMGAALLAALLIVPRYRETLPPPKERVAQKVAPTVAPVSEPAVAPASSPQMASVAAPRPKLESLAPTASSDALQDVVVTGAKRRRAEAPAPILRQNYAASQGAVRADAPAAETPTEASPRSADNSIRQTPALLHSAAQSGNLVQATALLDKGVSVNSRDAQGRTALMLAISQGQLEVVRLLLQRGADPNAADNAGKTPLQQATAQDLKDIVALLKGAGAR